MMLSIYATQIRIYTYTKSHCTKTHKVAQYAQQHPTRLCKQLYPQIVGLLFSAIRKYNNQSTYKQLPQCAGNTV